MSQKVLIVGLALAALAAILVFSQRERGSQTGSSGSAATLEIPVPAIRNKPAPDFALPNLDGETVQRADFDNKVLLVNFWATWCAPCLIEIPWFIEFQNQYGEQGLEVIGISLDEGGTKLVQTFVQEHQMNYTVLMGDEKAAETFGGILGLPTTFLVDRAGKYYSRHQGLVSRGILEEELKVLLAQEKAEPPSPVSPPASAGAPEPPAAAPPSSPAPTTPSPQKG